MAIENILERADSNFNDSLKTITEFVKYGAISKGGVTGRHAKQVRDLVGKVAQHLRQLPGDVVVRVHELPKPDTVEGRGAFPCISAEWWHGDGLPTILIYGHGDVQPPGDCSQWESPPFEAVVRKDRHGEKRLYGRGTSDDIGGWYSHVAAIRAWLSCCSKLPVNVRLFIEFEEEIGSPNLAAHVDQLDDFFNVDAMILTDCDNPSTTTPAFTTSLRGIAEADLCCWTTAGDHKIDPSVAMCLGVSQLLHSDDGRPTFALVDDIPKSRRIEMEDTDVDSDLPKRRCSNAEWAWRQPAITILGTSLASTSNAEASNSIQAEVSLRLSPGSNADDIRSRVEEIIKKPSPVPGVEFSARRISKTEVDFICKTSRETAGHSGIYGSVWSDPSCLALQRISLLADLDKAISIKETSLPSITAESLPRHPDSLFAYARLSIRVPPGSTADAVLDEVEKIVKATPLPGIKVELQRVMAGDGGAWLYEPPQCVAFDAADRAYKAVWGKRPVRIGIGGSIPFVKPFGERFGKRTPLILNGVLDPASALHAPNESLHLELFRKAVHTNIRLLEEFGRIPKGRFLTQEHNCMRG